MTHHPDAPNPAEGFVENMLASEATRRPNYFMERPWWDMTAGLSSGVPFAVDEQGRWRDIDTVLRGKACSCYCAECDAELIARKGEVRVHHFAHSDRKECQDALQASLFGMAANILGEPGADLQMPPIYSVSEMSSLTRRSERDVREAMLTAGLDDRLRGERLSLQEPSVNAARVQDSRAERPDIESKLDNVSLHLLSTRKRLPAISCVTGDSSRVLAINLVAFAWRWHRVCDQRYLRDMDLAPSVTHEFREWLATSTDGRGWVFHEQRTIAEQKVRSEFAKTDALLLKNKPSAVPLLTPVYFASIAPPRILPKRIVLPDQPDSILSMGVGKCRQCSSPLDEVRIGSGLFHGKRMLICRSDKKHPMVHLGA